VRTFAIFRLILAAALSAGFATTVAAQTQEPTTREAAIAQAQAEKAKELHPYVANKAGPDWLWGGGRDDLIRNLYFHPNGSFRRYGRLALMATLAGGSVALFWMLQPLM